MHKTLKCKGHQLSFFLDCTSDYHTFFFFLLSSLCHYFGNNPGTVKVSLSLLPFFTSFQVCAVSDVITIGRSAAALPFNELSHCLVDNRMNKWLSVLVAATAYPIR